MADGLQWFVVCTLPLMERHVAKAIKARGFEAYLPLRAAIEREKLRHKDRPLFSRYLFARFSPSDPRWVLVRDCPGVRMLIYEAGKLAPVPDAVVEAIRAREEDDGLIHLDVPARAPIPYEPGEEVQVAIDDPFGHQVFVEAIFQAGVDEDRVSVLLSLFGRQTKAVVPVARIKASPQWNRDPK